MVKIKDILDYLKKNDDIYFRGNEDTEISGSRQLPITRTVLLHGARLLRQLPKMRLELCVLN